MLSRCSVSHTGYFDGKCRVNAVERCTGTSGLSHTPNYAHAHLSLLKTLSEKEGTYMKNKFTFFVPGRKGQGSQETRLPPHLGLSLCLSLSTTSAHAHYPKMAVTLLLLPSGAPVEFFLSLGYIQRILSHAKIALLSRGCSVTLPLQKHNHLLIFLIPVYSH
jgi:hypothetical protein